MIAALRKFRPIHGWRAFAGEVGVIVLGVLIAVGIGKVAEEIDWRGRVATARGALSHDLEQVAFMTNERLIATACMQRQLDRLHAAILKDGSDGERMPLQVAANGLSTVYIHPSRPWSTMAWNAVVADNVPSDMPAAERADFESIYSAVEIISGLNASEQDDASAFNLLAEPVALDQRTRLDLLRMVARERQRVTMLALMSRQMQRRMVGMGYAHRPSTGDLAQMNTVRWCRANRLL